jgi:hypothetical protein
VRDVGDRWSRPWQRPAGARALVALVALAALAAQVAIEAREPDVEPAAWIRPAAFTLDD